MEVERRIAPIAWLTLGITALWPSPAWAYLDPGAGSMFIQGLIATLATAGYVVRLNWSRIRGWLVRSTAKAGPPPPAPPGTSDERQ